MPVNYGPGYKPDTTPLHQATSEQLREQYLEKLSMMPSRSAIEEVTLVLAYVLEVNGQHVLEQALRQVTRGIFGP